MGPSLRRRTAGGILTVNLIVALEAWAAQAPGEEVLEVPEVVVGGDAPPRRGH